MINVLINAYACSPHWGSEPGMAWNWISCLARHCNLFVITEGEWRKEIEEAVTVHPYRDHMHFYYNPVPDKIRRMCWNQGDWRFYWYYRKWQKKTLSIARKIVAENRIDILHQLNMIGFREPGYLWKIKGIPFVWGPIGGMELMPLSFLKGASKSQYIKAWVKNLINDWQRKHHPRVLRAIHKASALIAATKGCADVIQGYHHQNVILINETGCGKNDSPENLHDFHKPELELMWVGKFDFRKQLGLAIRSVATTRNPNIQLHVCGTGRADEVRLYHALAEKEGIGNQVVFHGKIPHDEMDVVMRCADLFFFTSIMEATSTVVLEAVSAGLPILSFNTCGFGPLVEDFAGITVQLSNPSKAVKDFASVLNQVYKNRYILNKISNNILLNRQSLTWESKAWQTVEIYKDILG